MKKVKIERVSNTYPTWFVSVMVQRPGATVLYRCTAGGLAGIVSHVQTYDFLRHVGPVGALFHEPVQLGLGESHLNPHGPIRAQIGVGPDEGEIRHGAFGEHQELESILSVHAADTTGSHPPMQRRFIVFGLNLG